MPLIVCHIHVTTSQTQPQCHPSKVRDFNIWTSRDHKQTDYSTRWFNCTQRLKAKKKMVSSVEDKSEVKSQMGR